MANRFKPGQRVVFVWEGYLHPIGIPPKVGEVVTIDCHASTHANSYILKEYRYTKNMTIQCMDEKCFKPLHYEFAENICKQLIRENENAN
jgi:hypothetical protein